MKRSQYAHLAWALCLGSSFAFAQQQPDKESAFEVASGIVSANDGSFNYQGVLNVDGQPANGDYSFRFEAFEDLGGFDIAHELLYFSPTVPVVDGLFNVDIQMGGTSSDARRFWREIGDQVIYFKIGVSEIQGGIYETLGPLTKLGWSTRAQYSGISESLRFPYADTYSNEFADPTTMMSLTNEFGGTVLELVVGVETLEPTLRVAGQALFNDGTLGIYAGQLQVNSLDQFAGVTAISQGFPILGLLATDDGSNSAAVLGEVYVNSDTNTIAVWALNQSSGNYAALGTSTYSGDFSNDVIVRDDLRVRGEPTRDYTFNNPSPIGPLAYGSVSSAGSVSAGTANLSASWDAGNLQYVVSVDGESMAFSTHTVSITVVDSFEPRVATFVANGGNLWVKIWDLNSGYVAVQDNFSIVIYDANPVVLNRMNVPGGVDLDQYSEKTGATLIQTQPRNEPVEPFENYGSGVTGD